MKAKELKLLRKRLAAADKVDDPLQTVTIKDKDSLLEIGQISYKDDKKASPSMSSLRLSYQSSDALQRKPNLLQECLELFEANMGDLYRGSSWGLNMDTKRDELQDKKARFLTVTSLAASGAENGNENRTSMTVADPATVAVEPTEENKSRLAAFVHFRFCYDDDDDRQFVVLYVYEIQVAEAYRRLGLGSRLMVLLEHVAAALALDKVMLTVFHKNTTAMDFYRHKLSYGIDESSPSQHGETAEYEILSKCSLLKR